MEFIIAKPNGDDVGFINKKAYLDIDIGETNDFLLKVNLKEYDSEVYAAGNILYCLNTEYGGILSDPAVDTKDGRISFAGDTFRGLLAKKIIEPPSPTSYFTLTGDLNTCLNTLIEMNFNSLYSVSDTLCGVSVQNYKFPRYCTLLEGIDRLLASKNHRLQINCEYVDNEIAVILSAVAVEDYSDEIEVSQDLKINFAIKQYTNLYNYMICYYETESEVKVEEKQQDGTTKEKTVKVKNPAVVRYHLLSSGNVSQVSEIPAGTGVKVHYKEFGVIDDQNEFIEEIKEEFASINETDTQEMTIAENIALSLNLGDVVGGRDYITGTYIKQAVSQIIIKLQNGTLQKSYKLGE